MTVKDIFSQITNHQISGMMVHEEFANYYGFLGLIGYQKCHEYQFIEESNSYREIYRYYIDHYNQLIDPAPIEPPNVIPSFWYGHTRQEVDVNTKKEGIKSGLTGWVSWERDTKKLYESLYNELVKLSEIAASEPVKSLVLSVDEELKEAEQLLLDAAAINYDLDVIIPAQKNEYKKYEKKFKKLF